MDQNKLGVAKLEHRNPPWNAGQSRSRSPTKRAISEPSHGIANHRSAFSSQAFFEIRNPKPEIGSESEPTTEEPAVFQSDNDSSLSRDSTADKKTTPPEEPEGLRPPILGGMSHIKIP